SGARKSISARARIMSVTRASKRSRYAIRACSMYVRKTALFTWPISSTSRKRTRSWCTKSKPSTGVMLAACPGFEERGFALAGEPGYVGRRGELEGGCDGVGERPVGEPGLGGAGGVRAVQALVGLVFDPQRQLHPLADVLLEEERAVDPDEARVRV